ncbi:hypothetical protein NB471_14800 [Vibrio alginolyticus]|uniref:hypothetical protein n=1 Tax=Vibrio alginolyticus TaxID=663 RepID=UPI00215BD625|nr:hypothetical protein [Vibrio alginolyticus]MCR9413821.1 hypothetical protein [Vibrio alginolyticus]
MSNLYWPIYKNLEKEVIELSNLVHFDDKQMSVYSVKISELLIRCAVEIESISKDLYLSEGGVLPSDRDLYFDTDCLQALEDKWRISKKVVILSSPNFHFVQEKNRVLTPLYKSYKRSTSGADWKKAYQAVKHERVQSLSKGNIGNLLRALGALFILNIYFSNEVYDLEKDSSATSFPVSCGSELFSIKFHKWSGNDGQGSYQRRSDFDECVYLSKWKTQAELDMEKATAEMQRSNFEYAFRHPKMLAWLQNNKIEDYKGHNLLWDVLGFDDYKKMLSQSSVLLNDVSKSIEYEAIVNKQNIR